MSEQQIYEGQDHIIRLRVWALGQMVWGAFVAGAVLAVIAAIVLVVWVVSQFLDARSKTMPSPYSAVQIVRTVEAV